MRGVGGGGDRVLWWWRWWWHHHVQAILHAPHVEGEREVVGGGGRRATRATDEHVVGHEAVVPSERDGVGRGTARREVRVDGGSGRVSVGGRVVVVEHQRGWRRRRQTRLGQLELLLLLLVVVVVVAMFGGRRRGRVGRVQFVARVFVLTLDVVGGRRVAAAAAVARGLLLFAIEDLGGGGNNKGKQR